jgi:RNA polymerase sigma factor (sigma-70 family)
MKDVYISREELYVPCPSPEYDRVFEKLIKKWWLPLFSYANKLAKKPQLAEELHVDTMSKLWENRHKIDRLYNFFVWAKRLMKNLYIDSLRKYWNNKRHIVDTYEPLETQELGWSSQNRQDTIYHHHRDDSDKGTGSKLVQNAIFVTQLLSVLTDDERDVIKAIYHEELTADEAAEKLKTTTPALKSKLYRSLRKMKQISGAAGCV